MPSPRDESVYLIQSARNGLDFVSLTKSGGTPYLLPDTVIAMGTLETARALVRQMIIESEGLSALSFRIVEYKQCAVYEV